MLNESINYYVTKRVSTFKSCKICNGKGWTFRSFRKMKFTEDCPVCSGKGKHIVVVTEEISLLQALNEIKYISK